MTRPKVSVIVVSYNRRDDLALAIEALLACRYQPLQIVVVDNDSKDGCADVAASYSSVEVIRNEYNAGFADGNNIGLRACDGAYVALVNNDAVVAEDWLARLVDFLEAHPRGAAAGGKQYLWNDEHPLGERNSPYYAYTLVDPDMGHSHAVMDAPDAVREVATLSGAAVMIRRAAIDDVGAPFLEPTFFTYYEETDFFARAVRRGWQVFYTGEPAVWHRIRAAGNPYHYFYHMERNRLLYVARNFGAERARLAFADAALRAALTFGDPRDLVRLARRRGDEGLETRAHVAAWGWLAKHAAEVARQRAGVRAAGGSDYDAAVRAIQARHQGDRPEVRALVPAEARRIVDVGCGAGALGRALKAERPGIEVRGVEIDPQAAALAAGALDAVSETGAEHGLPAGWERPDCVIFADVLEHLEDPWQVLGTWYEALAPGGKVVISLTNVSHFSVLAGLAGGRWDLLDHTQLRFFTRATAVELCESAGFRVLAVERRLELPNTALHRRLGRDVRRWSRGEGPRRGLRGARGRVAEGCTAEHLLVARKDEDPLRPLSGAKLEPRAEPVTSAGGSSSGPSSEADAAFHPDRPCASDEAPTGRPVVSVVIANHNYGAYLGHAIESVLRQTHEGFEIIVVDDGSSDDSEAVAARYGVTFVKQPRQGVSVARNRGASLARGEFLVFLDADDVLESNYLSLCLDALRGAAPEVAYAYSAMRMFGAEKGFLEPPPRWDANALLSANFVHASALLRREVFERVGGFDPSWRLGHEDYELWVRLLDHGYGGVFVADTVLHYRRHVTSRNTLARRELDELDWRLRLGYPRLYWRTLASHPLRALGWYRRLRRA